MLNLNNAKDAHANDRLNSGIIGWFTTVRPSGRPHTVPVWFLWDGSSILIFSAVNLKVRNLRSNPNVTLALDQSDEGGDVVVVEGTAELLNDPNIKTTLPAYEQKYGGQLKNMGMTAEQMAPAYPQGIRITPTKIIHYMD